MFRSGSALVLVVLVVAGTVAGAVADRPAAAAPASPSDRPRAASADDGTDDGDPTAAEIAGDGDPIDGAEAEAGAGPDEPRLLTPAPRGRRGAAWPGHRRQFGIGLQTGVSLRGIKPYDDEYCGQRDGNGGGDAAACIGRQPIALDLELTWGATAGIELLVETRLGIERDFGATASSDPGPRAFRLAPGARFYFSESGRTSFFSTAQVMFDLSGYQDPAGDSLGADIGIRNVNGFLIDLDSAYGFYVFVGETASFRRWLGAELEAGLGIQGRYP